ncbi:hypothetical protein [Cellulomonas composti]|uniref:Uncharacterized protein n=1 Tax=Cellulomonas composti TaxID=266130 RepID=A0A511J7W1_9CELL|nr:hypothetical protein [Cellulomonas composti]GEL94068.1 hypothetical protein CCO02nite_07260 [Cellulomonas composti]
MLFTVCNSGDEKGTVLYWEADTATWYHAKGNGADTGRPPVDPADLVVDDPVDDAAAQNLTSLSVGAEGAGVANVLEPTTLRTDGLITCMAWLLYNAGAAYLTHIVIGNPKWVTTTNLAAQVKTLADEFEKESGTKPTDLVLKVNNLLHYGNADTLTDWMRALVPPGVRAPDKLLHGGNDYSYVVKPRDGAQPAPWKLWRGAPIELVEVKPAEDEMAGTGRGGPPPNQAPSVAWRPRARTGPPVEVPNFSDSDES